MAESQCPFHGQDVSDELAAGLAALNSHPDDTAEIDALEDPIQEIAAKLQAMGPVIKGRGVGDPPGSKIQFGDVVLPNIFVASDMVAKECFAAVGYNAAMKVYLNPKIFASKVFKPTFGNWGPILTTMDPPEHPKYRAVMQQGFTPEAVEKYKKDIIGPVLARHFAELKGKGRADLVRELTGRYAYEVTSTLSGFPREDMGFMASRFDRAHHVNTDPEGAAKANAELHDYAQAKVEERRAEPRHDVISLMLNSKIDGEPIRDENLVALTTLLMLAGIDTVFKQSGIIIYLLLSNPDQFDILKSNRELIPRFIEEGFRYQGIGNDFARQATQDTELEGVHIPKDAVVFTPHGIINRDPSRWSNSDKLDLMREQKQHMLFSAGAHTCLGKDVARAAIACLVEHLIDDLPNLKFDPDHPTPRVTGWTLRAPLTLPVVWDT